MGNWEGLNRRKFPRANFPCLVVIRKGADDRDVILTHTENIGIGGVGVILKKEIKMFHTVDLELDLLDMGGYIRCKGKVVWSVQRKDGKKKKPLFYDIGIEYENLQEKDLKRLEEIIKNLAQKQPTKFSGKDV